MTIDVMKMRPIVVKVVHDVVVVCRRLCLVEKVSAGDFFFCCGGDLCWFMAALFF
jgi:hypothetical protein